MSAPPPMNEPGSDEAIFAAALQWVTPAQRAAYLDEACAGKPDLRRRVEELLRASDAAGTFLDRPVGQPKPSAAPVKPPATIQIAFADDPTEAPGAKIGRYKLLQQIGEGGCGTVFMAEQEEPVRRRVALKVIKLGMDTKSVIARFEAERQALAMMDHPNIAKVLDAGATDSGRPYFVMELVRGIPITRYCDENKLDTQQRLDLFIKVCQAIQHAHQKGIIHRDIKPSNILVTLHDGVPVPKVIDFGIAKATEGRLTNATLFTAFEQFIGTPAYMSPEQAEMSGLDIDTRSDIYALGVLLYELLTGKTPFDAKELAQSGIDAMRKTIREQEPQRPSTRLTQDLVAAEVTRRTAGHDEPSASSRRRLQELVNLIRGDLDWIVMKCLEKDRTRRYDTATGLAADLKRHLSNEPVVARPPSAAYKLQKTWQRHKVLVTTGLVVSLSLSCGIGVSLSQAHRARAAERAKQVLLESEQTARQEATRAQAGAVAERDNARRSLYAANINLANQSWNEGNLGKTRRLLAATTPAAGEEDLRGWEWRYLWGRTRGDDLGEIARFGGGVFQVAFVNGDRNVTAGLMGSGAEERGSLLLDFSPARLSNRRLLGNSPFGVTGYLPGKNWLLCSQWDASGRVTDVVLEADTLKEIRRLPAPGVLKSVSASADGQRVAAYHEGGEVRLWRLDDWSQISITTTNRRSGSHFGAVSFLGTGDRLGLGWSTGELSVHDSQSGERLRQFRAHDWSVSTLAVSPATNLLATGSGYEETAIKLWNPDTGALIRELTGHRAWVTKLAFSPDGTRLASASADQTIRLWDTATWKETAVLQGHEDEVYCLSFSSDGHRLVTGAKDGSVRLWQVPPVLRAPALLVISEPVRKFSASPDSQQAVTLGRDYALWDLETGTKVVTLTALGGYDAGFDFSADGRRLLTGGEAGRVRVWDFQQNQPGEFDAGGQDAVIEVRRLGMDGLMATGHGLNTVQSSQEKRIKIWHEPTRRLLKVIELNGSRPTALAIARNGDAASGNMDGTLTIWNRQDGSPRTNLPAHRRIVTGVAFTPDGTILATAGEEGTAKLWAVATLREIAVLRGHLRSVHAVDISPDGKRLATAGGGAESVKLWDVQTQQELATLAGEGSTMQSLAFTRDGNKLIGLNNEGHLHLWRAPAWAEITAAEAKDQTGPRKP